MASSKHSPLWKVVGLLLPAVAIVATVVIFIVGVIKAVITPGPDAPTMPARDQGVITGARDAGSKR
jgi:hypothetical protein